MDRKYLVPVMVLASMTILQSPAYSQLEMPKVTTQSFGFQPNTNPSSNPSVVGRSQPATAGGFNQNQGQPGLSNMMSAWENETDPTKKSRLARQIQTRVGVKADGIIGNQTMQAIQQAGGMGQPAPGGGFNPNPGQPAPGGGFNPNPGQPAPGGGGLFGNLFGQRPAGAPPPPPGGGFNPNPGQPAPGGGGLFGNLFGPRPNQPGAQGVNNLMREWELEPNPNKKRLIAMEIQENLGVKADGIIGNQTRQAIQQAGGMGQPAPGGGFNPNPGQPAPGGGFNPNPGQPAPGGGGLFGNIFGQRPAGAPPPPPGGGFNPNPGQPAPGGGGLFGNIFGQRPAGTPPPGFIFGQRPAGTPPPGFNPNPGQPAPGGGFNPNPGGGFNPNPGGGFNPNPGGGFNPNPGGGFNPNPGGGFNPNPGGGGGPGGPVFNPNPGGGGPGPGGGGPGPGGGGPGPGPGGGDPGPGPGGGDPGPPPSG